MNGESAQPLELDVYEDWRDYAECDQSGIDADMFFESDATVEGRRAIAEAKRICGQCAVQAYCLDYAFEARQTLGIWGGYTAEERKIYYRRMIAQRRKGRIGA
jgi:WhiB family redox-sensing transcriptional regulator